MLFNPALARTLRATVTTICREFPRRHVWNPTQLDGCADWLEKRIADMGFTVQTDAFEATFWTDAGGAPAHRRVRNLLIDIPGQNPKLAPLVIGAHYDSRHGMAARHARQPVFETDADAIDPRYADTPGANDNASGMAALLAILDAQRDAPAPPARGLQCAFWVNEEYPFFRDHWRRGRWHHGLMRRAEGMGSHVHARRLRDSGQRIMGAIALDTLGCYDDGQGYAGTDAPRLERLALDRVFPRRHDYAAFLTDARHLGFTRRAATAFRAAPASPRLIVRGFPLVAALNQGWSDDWSFWKAGYPAFCVTDGAYIRSPHYHRVTDTPETLNYPVFAATVQGLIATVRQLTGAT